MRRLILFDIDGTLLATDGAGRRAFERCLRALFGRTGPIETYDFHGKTDPQIVYELLAHDGVLHEVEKGATESKTTVKSEVLASSAMVVGEKRDPDRIPVLLFVNQTTTSSATTEPSVALNRVRFDMVRSDGTWLVDGITSY